MPHSRILLFSILFSATMILPQGCAGTAGSRRNGADGRRPMRALYLPNHLSRNLGYIKGLIKKGEAVGINMLVLDAQRYLGMTALINPKVFKHLKKHRIHIASRVVCFQDGLKRLPASALHLKRLYKLIEDAARAGADEIQLDYIRFADAGLGYSLTTKYRFISKLLKRIKTITDKHNVILSADIFGRVAYNKYDPIGQRLEEMAKYCKVLCPMLYPSHFTLSRHRMANPGFTVKEGTTKAMKRLKGTGVEVQPYIQAFAYQIGWARVSLVRYIELQIEGAESTGCRGWVAWNAFGRYDSVFKALKNIADRKATAKKRGKDGA